MGGAESIYTGLNHLDRFAWIGSFSGAFVMWPRANRDAVAPAVAAAPAAVPATTSAAAPATTPATSPVGAPAGGRGGRGPQSIEAADFEKNLPDLNAKANSRIRLLWIACGTEDGLNNVNRQLKAWLKSKDVKFTDVEVPGYAHVWPLWRQNLAELAPMLFQSK
jgi:enterochelin esterase-like enzyme